MPAATSPSGSSSVRPRYPSARAVNTTLPGASMRSPRPATIAIAASFTRSPAPSIGIPASASTHRTESNTRRGATRAGTFAASAGSPGRTICGTCAPLVCSRVAVWQGANAVSSATALSNFAQAASRLTKAPVKRNGSLPCPTETI